MFKWPVSSNPYCCCFGACPYCNGCPGGVAPYTFQFTIAFSDPVSFDVILTDGVTHGTETIKGMSGLNGTYVFTSSSLTGNSFPFSGLSGWPSCPGSFGPVQAFGCSQNGGATYGCDAAEAFFLFGFGLACFDDDSPGHPNGCVASLSVKTDPAHQIKLCSGYDFCTGQSDITFSSSVSCPSSSLSLSGTVPSTGYCLLSGATVGVTVTGT